MPPRGSVCVSARARTGGLDMSAQTTPAPQSTPVPAREARLVSVLSKARRRTAIVPTERWLLALGGGLILAGIVLVLIGWVGTSRTVLVAGQIPYVVSGGLLGLGLIFLGGFLYFGYWLALLFRHGTERGRRSCARTLPGGRRQRAGCARS